MEWVYGILNIIATFLLGLFLKSYFPSYMDEKGKNLATKEDVKEITQKTEEVKDEFRKSFEEYTSDLKFKNEYYYKQYSELYTRLYIFVCQSEYLRYIHKLHTGEEILFDEKPFLSVLSKRAKEERTTSFSPEIQSTYNREEIIEDTVFSKYNAKSLCKIIIDNGHLASPKLLKLAVFYQYAQYHSSNKDSELKNTTLPESVALSNEIFRTIVKEYNVFRKELKIDFNDEELDTGILKIEF